MGSSDKGRGGRISVHRLTVDAMFLGCAMILSYLEAILPLGVWIPLPGFKPGLCNIVIMWMFVRVSPWDAAAVSFCRIFLMGLLFGNVTGLWFSLCGGAMAYGGLWLLARLGRRYFSMAGVGIGCAALHNLGQILAAGVLLGMSAVVGYLPFLLVASVLFGGFTGLILNFLLKKDGLLQKKEKV